MKHKLIAVLKMMLTLKTGKGDSQEENQFVAVGKIWHP
jgi:hypothetical protein